LEQNTQFSFDFVSFFKTMQMSPTDTD